MSDAPPVLAETARARLRRETADLHAELDGLLSRTNFDDARSYALFLARQAAPLAGIESALATGGIEAEMLDWSQRSRVVAIRRDLETLGDVMPPPMRTPPFAGHDERLGAVYVLEGSRLGAKYLSRAARASSDPAVRNAVAYLTHGEGHALWPGFLAMLARWDEAGGDQERLVQGARDAFALFLAAAKDESAAIRADADA